MLLKRIYIFFICLMCMLNLQTVLYSLEDSLYDEKNYTLLKIIGDEAPGASLVFLNGKAKHKVFDTMKWEKALLGNRIEIGEEIATDENSTLIIVLDDKTIVYLYENSHLIIKDINLQKRGEILQVNVELVKGTALIDAVNKKHKFSKFSIQTQNSLATCARAQLMVRVIDNNKTVFAVFESEAFVYNSTEKNIFENETLVNTNQETMVLEYYKPAPVAEVRKSLYVYKKFIQNIKKEIINHKYLNDIEYLYKRRMVILSTVDPKSTKKKNNKRVFYARRR